MVSPDLEKCCADGANHVAEIEYSARELVWRTTAAFLRYKARTDVDQELSLQLQALNQTLHGRNHNVDDI